MATIISKYDDIIESNDVIEAIEELRAELADVESGNSEGDASEIKCELDSLLDLQDEAICCTTRWNVPGELLIRDSYFEQYAQDLAGDLGAINPDISWPTDCIDWERAAHLLKQDHDAVELCGITYWIRRK